ncbi:COL8A [Mytilus edulis]|uniref:COL8A n=1 Tax=Mytilus edulis TaxID=6550 RepID=A0A8S3PVB6_MYTED|nr:COL8A [Mytilus edulis]
MKLTDYFTYILILLLCAEMVMGTCESDRKLDKVCQCGRRTNIPAFSAMLTYSLTPGNGKAIKFDKVVTNILNGYNPTSGIFTALVPGVYHFSYTVMTEIGKYLVVYLTLNNTKQHSTWLLGPKHETGTTSIILNLKKGDQVAVKSADNNFSIFSNSNMYSSFSGYLISQ